jgi:hypothetical protein
VSLAPAGAARLIGAPAAGDISSLADPAGDAANG